MQIEVTAKHIEEGLQGDLSDCPVALAIVAHLHTGVYVEVYPDEYYILAIQTDAILHREKLPEEVTSFILHYDDSEVEAKHSTFSFNLDIPEGYLQRDRK